MARFVASTVHKPQWRIPAYPRKTAHGSQSWHKRLASECFRPEDEVPGCADPGTRTPGSPPCHARLGRLHARRFPKAFAPQCIFTAISQAAFSAPNGTGHSLLRESCWTSWSPACGGPSLCCGERRRFLVCAALEVLIFRLYGKARRGARSVRDAFPNVRCKDIAARRQLPNLRIVLSSWNATADARRAGVLAPSRFPFQQFPLGAPA